MYLEYWGLNKHPFNNVPDPEMYFDMHQSVDSAVSEILFAIEEGDEILAVVVGPVGAGKTMSLRIVLDSIDHEKYRIAFVTNPDMTFPQLLREIIGQIEGKACEERRKDALLENFNRLLFETSDLGKRIVIFIDEGNVIKPHNLESLRLLTNMQDDTQNLFTIVLAGQPELGKRLEDPRRANLFQRIGVYCRIKGIDSAETMRDYVEHRLERAGNPPERKIFTDDAVAALWSISEGGIPRIINKICKLSLKAAETNNLSEIDRKVVSAIGMRFMRTITAGKKKSEDQKPEIQKLEEHPFKEEKTEDSGQKTDNEQPATEAPKPTPLEEIAPTPEDTEKVHDELEHIHHAAHEHKDLTDKELEELASRLATERVKTMKQVSDPFEAWETARDDILQQIRKSREKTTVKETQP